ncbi:MAG: hypothetical protein ACHQUC_03115 [Chlamydiales bacterium]
MASRFVSFESEIRDLIERIVEDSLWHGRWLNTLSYLENCGARKIAACEHPTQVREEMLKHAAEEFRHAFYLKKQLARIGQSHEDYRCSNLLGGWSAYHYLDALDLHIVRFLKNRGMANFQIKPFVYALVTYAIELRAGELYSIYQMILKNHHSKVQVQSIIFEEKEHLNEMEEELKELAVHAEIIEKACAIESHLFKQWLNACQLQLSR